MSVKADYSMKSARKLLQVESNVNTDYSIRGATPLSCYPATFSARFSSFFSPNLTLFHCFILTGQSTMRCGHFLLHLCYPTCFPSMLSFHLWISLFFTKKSGTELIASVLKKRLTQLCSMNTDRKFLQQSMSTLSNVSTNKSMCADKKWLQSGAMTQETTAMRHVVQLSTHTDRILCT